MPLSLNYNKFKFQILILQIISLIAGPNKDTFLDAFYETIWKTVTNNLFLK